MRGWRRGYLRLLFQNPMRLILTGVISLSLILIILIGLALIVGHMQPPATAVTMLHLTDCTPPCWINITPRQTLQREVKTLFSKAYPNHEPFFIIVGKAGGGVQMETYSTIDPIPASTDIVSSILIGDMDKSRNNVIANSTLMPRIGDVLLLWGAPTCINLEAPDFWRLRYYRGKDGLSVIDILLKGRQLQPKQAIYYFSFYHTSRYGNECLRPDKKPWLGFANVDRYGMTAKP